MNGDTRTHPTFGDVVGITDEKELADALADSKADRAVAKAGGLHRAGRTEARQLIAGTVSQITSFDVTDALAGVWNDHAALTASIDRSGKPHEDGIHPLSPQRIVWNRNVTIDVTFGNVVVHDLSVDLTATAELAHMTATVVNRRITHIQSGHANLICKLELDGVDFAHGSLPVNLNVDVDRGDRLETADRSGA